jgi:hypothetical protein
VTEPENPFASPEADPAPDSGRTPTQELVLGFFTHMGLSVGIPVVLMLIYVGFFLAFAIGVAQVLWGAPLAFVRYREGRVAYAQGVLGAMALVFMLNATCFVLVLGAGSNFH